MIIIKSRNTFQKTVVYNAVNSLHDHPSADSVYEAARCSCPGISRATVYRILNGLAAEQKIRRIPLPDAPDRFDFVTLHHYHFYCTQCGRVFDYKTAQIIEKADGLNPGFRTDSYELIFRGRCKYCKEADHGC